MTDKDPIWHDSQGMRFAGAPDALWHDAPMPFVARYRLLGIPLEFVTNAAVLAELASETFRDGGAPGAREEAAAEESAAEAPGVLRLRVFLHDVPERRFEYECPTPICRMQGEYFVMSLGGSLAFADRAAGFATAFVTPALVADRFLAQAGVLECLSLYLARRLRPATLHAAALVHRSRCMLLTGANGAGKSTLAYACLRAGFQILAEDIVFCVDRSGPVEVWGHPGYLHLRPDAERFFPEVRAAPRVRHLNGETKLRIHVNGMCPGAAVPNRPAWGVCSLSRAQDGRARLLPAIPAQVRRALQELQGGPPPDRNATEAVTNRLLTGRLAHLEVGTDLDAAVDLLRRWIESE